MKNKKIDRGEALKNAIKNSDLNITQVTKRAGYSRGSYYNHIADPELPYEVLETYGKVLHYDFSHDFPDMMKYISFSKESDIEYMTVDQLRRELEKYKKKYHELLEKYYDLKENNK